MCSITTYVSHMSFTLVGLYDLQWEGQICFAHNSHSTYCDAFMSPNVLSSKNVNDTCGECEAWCASRWCLHVTKCKMWSTQMCFICTSHLGKCEWSLNKCAPYFTLRANVLCTCSSHWWPMCAITKCEWHMWKIHSHVHHSAHI